MIKKEIILNVLWGLLAGGAIGLLIATCCLPSSVVIHINGLMQVDAVGSPFVMLPLSILPLGISVALIIVSITKVEIKSKNIFYLFMTVLNVFLLYIGWLMYGIANMGLALGDTVELSMAMLIIIPIAILFIIMGNFAPLVEPNRWFGLRLAKMTKDPIVWRKTQRMGGLVLFVSGFILLISAIVLGLLKLDVWIFLPLGLCIIASIVAPLVVAHRAVKQQSSTPETTQQTPTK